MFITMSNAYYLGLDVGSVSTNLVVTDENDKLIKKLYLLTSGKPVNVLTHGLQMLLQELPGINISGVGTTGSGRQLASVITGADIVKNEITAHAVAAQKIAPNVRTIIEIGGQDSKIILLRNGVVIDFAMNTVCAAGTGSFLDRQAARLEIPIEEFGGYALRATAPTRIAGRCAVFAESDMIHKQQTGHSTENIIAGLCEALVRNYLTNLAKGKDIEEPVLFQGGVAANIGIVAAFEKQLKKTLIIPQHHDVMGAIGAAILARRAVKTGAKTVFAGFSCASREYVTKSIECSGCSNCCEVIEISYSGTIAARFGDKCGKWSNLSIAV
jgi:predicted CoA-substrate-specific enzyme activase